MARTTPLLVTPADVGEHAGTEVVTAEEIALAVSKIRYASAQALHYGDSTWTAVTAPSIVIETVLEAACRGYLNPGGLEQERGDTLSYRLHEDWSAGATFTEAEIKLVSSLTAGKAAIYSVQLVRPDRLTEDFVTAGGDDF